MKGRDVSEISTAGRNCFIGSEWDPNLQTDFTSRFFTCMLLQEQHAEKVFIDLITSLTEVAYAVATFNYAIQTKYTLKQDC